MKRSLVVLSVLALVAAGCGNDKKAPEPTTTTSAPTTTQAAPTGVPPAVALNLVMNFDYPTAMAQRHDDDAFYVAEKAGRVQALRDGAVAPVPVLDISDEVSTEGERGLLGIAFAPRSRVFYVYFTDKAGTIHVTEFTLGPDDVADTRSRRDLLTIPHPRTNHNGGQLAFGHDGHLYIGVGDGGGGGDPDRAAQNLTVLLGKILRINPTPTTTAPYTIPYDNPLARQAGARGEIWAYGLRNPWRFSFDTHGDRGIWISDVGQDKWEEVNHVPADPKGGQNYGWSLREGSHKFRGEKPKDAVDPVHEYARADGNCSVIGGYVYRGAAIEGLQGRYVFGDFCSGILWALTQKGTASTADSLQANVPNLVSFAQDKNGELFVMDATGQLLQIVAK